jgi:hypothetical protein
MRWGAASQIRATLGLLWFRKGKRESAIQRVHQLVGRKKQARRSEAQRMAAEGHPDSETMVV